MNDDLILAAIHRLESKVDGLDEKLDKHREDYLPRIAQVEYRVTALEQAGQAKGDRRWQTRLAVVLALLALVGQFVTPLLGG